MLNRRRQPCSRTHSATTPSAARAGRQVPPHRQTASRADLPGPAGGLFVSAGRRVCPGLTAQTPGEPCPDFRAKEILRMPVITVVRDEPRPYAYCPNCNTRLDL